MIEPSVASKARATRIKQTAEEGGYRNRGRERRQLKVDAEEAGKRGEATRK